MSTRWLIGLLVVSLCVTVGVRTAPAQDGVASGGVGGEWADRLGLLTPDEPAGYLRLGEEILAVGRTDDARTLARRLFALAYEHARLAGDRPGVQASACIALADTARFERDRRWLWSIARLIDPRYSEPDWSRTVDRPVSDADAFRAATTLGLLRAGEGARAKEILRDESVRDVFRWYSGLLTGTGPGDVLGILDDEADRWPCPECRNERVVRSAAGTDAAKTRCFTCRGTPGWQLGHAGLLATLRFESRVLSGVQRSWGAQLAADLGEPLRDPDPAAVADAVGVDVSLSVYRQGRWAAPGDGVGGAAP